MRALYIYIPAQAYLTFVNLFPRKMNKSHLNGFALDPVDEAVADGAAHEKDEVDPAERHRNLPSPHPLQPLPHQTKPNILHFKLSIRMWV